MTRIDDIKFRLGTRTLGKWIAPGSTGVLPAAVVSTPTGRVVAFKCASDEDADFIANAPDDIEYLLAEVERLQREAS